MALLASAARFDDTLLVIGALLVLGALASAVTHRSVLSPAAIFVVAGLALGRGGAGVLHFTPRSEVVRDIATIGLVVILFRDGLEVDREMLRHHWSLPLRKLVLAMPLTALIVGLAVRALVGLTWTESLLVGALLAPTDPILSSSVVTDPRVPAVVRHSLNLESGLNDGLALPGVLALSAALQIGGGHFVWWRFLLENIGLGFLVGAAAGLAGARLLPRSRGLGAPIAPHQRTLSGLGFALATYGVTAQIPNGNGLIAVYVAAIVLGIRRADLRETVAARGGETIELVKLLVFVVFGSVLTLPALLHDGWAAVGVVAAALLVARPVAVFIALAGTSVDLFARGFMAWFGPKGVATMTFALLVLSDRITAGPRIFDLAALAVFTSILAHGLTDTAGAELFARRARP